MKKHKHSIPLLQLFNYLILFINLSLGLSLNIFIYNYSSMYAYPLLAVIKLHIVVW